MYPIDELANIVAMASELEQVALTDDIRDNGQREPAVLWQGRLVDGRCRQLACEALGVPLLTRELSSSMSREEVAKVVQSLNTRRNLTDTQKAMSGYKAQLADTALSNEATAKKWGIPLGTYKNARFIGVNKPELVEPLFNGSSVVVYDPDKGTKITTSRINTLARIIKRTMEMTIVVDDSKSIDWKCDAAISTEAGKAWYYEQVATMERTQGSPTGKIIVQQMIAELANYKFGNQ